MILLLRIVLVSAMLTSFEGALENIRDYRKIFIHHTECIRSHLV
jgi:hypothetical protein